MTPPSCLQNIFQTVIDAEQARSLEVTTFAVDPLTHNLAFVPLAQ